MAHSSFCAFVVTVGVNDRFARAVVVRLAIGVRRCQVGGALCTADVISVFGVGESVGARVVAGCTTEVSRTPNAAGRAGEDAKGKEEKSGPKHGRKRERGNKKCGREK